MLFRIIMALALIACTALPTFAGPVKTGAEVLRDSGFALLRGVKFGLVTNSTAVVDGVHILDLLQSAGITPVVIFTPEHGLKATAEDGVRLLDSSDHGLPVISLYGRKKQPEPEDLKGLDLLVFDIQDIGVRFYTYISTMGLVMQSAASAGIPLMVLDRPNPLGGDYIAGFVRKDLPASFTSLYPLPIAHGLTVGELARMIQGESWLPGLDELDLQVIPMQEWQRWMRWPDTGLSWRPTSPNIPDFETALLYPGIGLLEGTGANEGRGTAEPFRLAGLPEINAGDLAARLNGQQMAGVRFEPADYTPRSLPGRATAPKWQNREVHGIRIVIDDYRTVEPVEIGVAVAACLYEALPPQAKKSFFRNGFSDLAGSAGLRQAIEAHASGGEIPRQWDSDLEQFSLQRRNYLLYGDDAATVGDQPPEVTSEPDLDGNGPESATLAAAPNQQPAGSY